MSCDMSKSTERRKWRGEKGEERREGNEAMCCHKYVQLSCFVSLRIQLIRFMVRWMGGA